MRRRYHLLARARSRRRKTRACNLRNRLRLLRDEVRTVERSPRMRPQVRVTWFAVIAAAASLATIAFIAPLTSGSFRLQPESTTEKPEATTERVVLGFRTTYTAICNR